MESETAAYQELKVPKTYYGSIDDFSEKHLEQDIDVVITGEITDQILGDAVSKKFNVDHKVVLSTADKDYVHLTGLIDHFKHNGGLPTTVAAVGGGSIADYAKVLAEEIGANLVIFTTALSHDGLVSGRSSLRKNGTKGSYRAKIPKQIIAFSEVIESSDPELTTNGWGDHISKYSSLSEWNFAVQEREDEMFDNELYAVVRTSLDDLSMDYQQLFDYFIRSGNVTNFFGSSRPLSGGEHAIAHALSNSKNYKGDAAADLDHGKRVAAFGLFILGLYDEFGVKSEIHWSEYKTKMGELKLPTTLSDLGITYCEFQDAVLAAPQVRERYGILDYLQNKGVLGVRLVNYNAKKVGLVI